ncbi:Outer membrane porin F precursor [Terricaulis silvestris]|uniref:Outer membrane porin F n=2 Tax=Terricaulis silvestris TaxID=2686094 RepID=A0A6I6MWF1_9CAUL|nr:Outer membrane porin F precursor [Terricaulis silvestris]
MRTLLLSVCAGSLLAGAAMAQTVPPAGTPPPVQCIGAEGVVYFDLGSARLNAESQSSLQDVANARRADCTTQITLTGHTDATGSVARNRRLAQQRAEAVKQQLVSLGVPPEEIAIAAAAESMPQSDSEDRLNRRVTVVLAASPATPLAEPAT